MSFSVPRTQTTSTLSTRYFRKSDSFFIRKKSAPTASVFELNLPAYSNVGESDSGTLASTYRACACFRSLHFRDLAKNSELAPSFWGGVGGGRVDWTSCCSYLFVPILSPRVWPMDFLQSIQGRIGRLERFQKIATGFGQIGIAVSLLHLSIIWYTFSHSIAMLG